MDGIHVTIYSIHGYTWILWVIANMTGVNLDGIHINSWHTIYSSTSRIRHGSVMGYGIPRIPMEVTDSSGF